MIRVSALIEKLKEFPEDSWAYSYECSTPGIVIVKNVDGVRHELGFIIATESDQDDSEVIQ